MAAQTVIWHPEAKEDYREIIDYLLDEWPLEVADKFTDQIDEVVRMVEKHPNIGMRVGRLHSVRKIAVPPHYLLYYVFFPRPTFDFQYS